MNRDREALRGLRNIATTIREKVLKPNATLQGREYVQLGIDLNNALDAANDILALPVGGGVEEALPGARHPVEPSAPSAPMAGFNFCSTPERATAQEFYHPEPVVMFRAGLLACREYMARFVEQGGDAATAASIRANWWPALGDDPGAPRLFDYSELVTETGDEATPFISHTPPVNREAAVEAHVFLHHVAAGTLMPYREAAAPPQAPVAGSEDPASEERERIARITARGEEPSVADWEVADMILGGFTWEGKGHV